MKVAYKIPLFDLNFDEAETKAVLDVLASRWISIGPRNAELERRFADLLGVRYALAVANCTAALHLALRVLDIGKGDEVLVPSLTFIATANAVRYVDATPVFCDIAGPEDLNMDPARAAELVTRRTKAMLLMHYGGFPCEMDRFHEIAVRHGLCIVEDASHGPLSEYNGTKLGAIGEIGCFSFFSNKNISTGEGGMLVTGSKHYFTRAKLLRSHGMTTLSYERAAGQAVAYDVVELGYNYRMDDIRAAIALVQIDKLEADLRRRSEIRERYIERLSEIEEVIVPFADNRNNVSNYIFPIVLRESNAGRRDVVRKRLHERGVQTSVHYPAVHRFSMYRQYGGELDNTEYVADNEITLPIFAGLRDEDVDFVADCVAGAVRS
jgi:dTDP-4-amino-4,6-dideoxygalactose transaminase